MVGHTPHLLRDPFGLLETLQDHGDVVRYSALGRDFTALFHPDHVERVLVEDPDRFDRYLFSEGGLGFAEEGVLFNDNSKGDRQRRLMRPAFTMDRIRSYADTMAEYAVEMANEWDDGEVIALNEAFSDLALRIMAKALFDVRVDPDGEDSPIGDAARAINARAAPEGLDAVLPEWVPTPTRRRYDDAMERYRERMDELIDDRRSEDGNGDDLLSLLLSAEGEDGETFSESEVRDNLVTFMFAGHETTSLALTYTVLSVAKADGSLSGLQSELSGVLDGDRPRFEHAPKLEYTDRVLKESMRLYPPVYAFWREATEDAVFDGYRVPEGTYLTLPQYCIHRDERFYEDPMAFEPDRWTEERASGRPEYAYFPFGGGPRHCIGMRFAMLEMKLVLAAVTQRFEFELESDPDPDFRPMVTLQPADDVRVRVHRR